MARRRTSRSFLVFLTILAFLAAEPGARPATAAPGSPPGPYLIKDINTVPASSVPDALVDVDGRLYFAASDAQAGRELWASVGTITGTVRLRDIYPGVQSSQPEGLTEVTNPLSGRSTLFFSASDPDHGKELWQSDGTAAGTRLVADIRPGPDSSYPSGLVAVGATLFFSIRNASNQAELWKSNGTAAGTQRVTGATWSGSLTGLTAAGNLLFFRAGYPGSSPLSLWRSDGTAPGTFSLPAQLGTGCGYSAAFQGRLFFCGQGPEGMELWSSDGTLAGTGLAKDIAAGTDSSWPKSFTVQGALLYFSAATAGTGEELWRTDGTAAGTTLIKDIWPGTDSSSLSSFSAGGGWLFFSAISPDSGRELWKSNGTTDGTTLVKDIMPGSTGSAVSVFLVTTRLTLPSEPPRVYFTAAPEGDQELWVSDGMPDGTVRVKDIRPGPASSSPFGLIAIPSKLPFLYPTVYFRADDGLHGQELWRSEGTAASTQLVKDLAPGNQDSVPQAAPGNRPLAMGDRVFFAASDGRGRAQLWQTDATATGTARVVGDLPSPVGYDTMYLTGFQGKLFFSAIVEVTGGNGLWLSDGTASGTQRVQTRGADQPWDPHELTVAGQRLFFAAKGWPDGWELWQSDGTGQGTMLVRAFAPTNGEDSPHGLLALNDELFFVASDGLHGQELWQCDGTGPGTAMVANINLVGDGIVAPLVAMDGVLYFAGNDGTHGLTLWRSDGSADGTQPVISYLASGLRPGQPLVLTVAGHMLFFAASIAGGDAGDIRLWRSDGTAGGTRLAKVTNPSNMGQVSLSSGLAAVGKSVYFAADRGTGDWELWKSDGTDAGTVRVKDINTGPAPSSPGQFSACDPGAGCEPWISDGTEAGTWRVADLNPGPESSAPRNWVLLGSTLLFAADDGVHGSEPWAWSLVGLYRGYLPLLRK